VVRLTTAGCIQARLSISGNRAKIARYRLERVSFGLRRHEFDLQPAQEARQRSNLRVSIARVCCASRRMTRPRVGGSSLIPMGSGLTVVPSQARHGIRAFGMVLAHGVADRFAMSPLSSRRSSTGMFRRSIGSRGCDCKPITAVNLQRCGTPDALVSGSRAATVRQWGSAPVSRIALAADCRSAPWVHAGCRTVIRVGIMRKLQLQTVLACSAPRLLCSSEINLMPVENRD